VPSTPRRRRRTVLVVARHAGASAEEVEQQVTIPLEVALAGMPGLKCIYSQTHLELSHLSCVFEGRVEPDEARRQVIARLATLEVLPAGVTPVIAGTNSGREILRYTLHNPVNAQGQDIYRLDDLRTLQDWLLEREFRRLVGINEVISHGGTVKRYEILPDPERLKRYGVTLERIITAVAQSNGDVAGDAFAQGRIVKKVRSLDLIGGGKDPMERAFAMKTPAQAAAYLREQERTRLREIRQVVITSVNNLPIRIEDVVDGGPLPHAAASRKMRGVVVGWHQRLGRVGLSQPKRDAQGRDMVGENGERLWIDQDDAVQGIVWARTEQDASGVLRSLKAKIDDLNRAGRVLPGVSIMPIPGRGWTPPRPEDTLLIEAAFPVDATSDMVVSKVRQARKVLRQYGEVAAVVSEIGRPEDGTNPRGPSDAAFMVPLKSAQEWPAAPGLQRPRTRSELIDHMKRQLDRQLPGVDWHVSQSSQRNVLAPFEPDMGDGAFRWPMSATSSRSLYTARFAHRWLKARRCSISRCAGR
jgi:Cu/Ag efflux pump CusA